MAARNHAVDWVKWLAVVSMFLDHLKYVPGAPVFLFYAGRFAYPAFAVVCAYNACFHSHNAIAFALRVLCLAAACESLKLLLASGGSDIFPSELNPVFALAAGTFLLAATRQRGWRLALSFSLALPLVWAAGTFAGYGWAGVATVVVAGYSGSAVSGYVALAAVCAWLNLRNPEAAMISAASGVVALLLIRCGLPSIRCPLPNNRLLYLAFPASFLPPAIIRWIAGLM